MSQEERLDDILSKVKLSTADFEEIAGMKHTRSLSFLPKSKFPKHAFQLLADLERLQFLHFDNSKLNSQDLIDIARIKAIKRLDLSNCPIKDKMLPPLTAMPLLSDLWLRNTNVSDKGLAHIALINGLEWLILENTKVTDRGMSFLANNTNLKTLWLNKTKVSDKGLLQLKALTKLTTVVIKDSRISEDGLDLLFAAQQEQIRKSRRAKTIADPQEMAAAKTTLHGFFDAMKEWEESCAHNSPPDKEGGLIDVEAYDKYTAIQKEACRKIFSTYCTDKKRATGRPDNLSYQCPPEYDWDQHEITEVELESRSRISIYTKEDDRRHKFILLKKGGQWLVDHKKIWIDGWNTNYL